MIKRKIVIHATRLATKKGFRNVTRAEIATAAQCGTGTVSYHYESMDKLQDAMVEHAVQHKMINVLAQALAEQPPHPLAAALPDPVKKEVARFLAAQ